MSKQYMDRFPVTLNIKPGLVFSVKLGRKLFGKQRYGIIAEGTNFGYSEDYATREGAQLVANTATLLSKLWSIFEKDPGTIRSLLEYLMMGGTLEPGLSDRSIMGRLIYNYKPDLISSMLEDFPENFFN